MKKKRTISASMCLPLLLITALIATRCTAPENKPDMEVYPFYQGSDLGLTFPQAGPLLKVWAPTATEVNLRLYREDIGGEAESSLLMQQGDSGVWYHQLDTQHLNMYYTLSAKIEGKWRPEVPDPYAKAVGTNGLRGHIVDPSKENPEGWENDQAPPMKAFEDIVIYELHIRDFSIHPESGMQHKGKYLAFTEKGTSTPQGTSTGIDHLIRLGVTHVHLLPTFDYLSVDESRLDEPQFNWGYDPQNYNVPEGSYSSDPSDGRVRIREFKSMVKALHDAGIRVIMDVVYNHTGKVDGLSFDALVPGYYYRYWEDGSMGNASGCGNETASEKPMMRKFMIESLKYWMEEYHIDGFRFDLMAVHDIATMNQIEQALHAIRPDVFIYGEGWTAADSPLPENDRALKAHTYRMPGIAAFSDDIRDGIKGSWSDHTSRGFVGGKAALRESVKFGIVGAIAHEGVDSTRINNSGKPWALEPVQCIAYVSCHDNHTLLDKLSIAHPDEDLEELTKMHILANAIVLTSQAVPFIHAGAEFLRTKDGEENSYKSSDEINRLDWERKAQFPLVFEAYRDLIHLRKAHPAFRLGSAYEVRNRLHFLDADSTSIAYMINAPEEDSWKRIVVAFNGAADDKPFVLPDGDWQLAWLGSNAVKAVSKVEKVMLPARGAVIAYELR